MYTCFGPWPFNLFFPVLYPFWLGGSFMAQLSKVLKLVHRTRGVFFPPVSLQKQVVVSSCCCLCIRFRGEPILFPGWCANKKLCYTYSNLWLVTLHPCFQPASLSHQPRTPTKLALASRIGSRRVTHQPGCVWSCLEELSEGRSSGPDHKQHSRATTVVSHPATKATTLHWRGGWRGPVWGVRETGWKHGWSHKSEVAITELLFAPTRKQCLCWKRHNKENI